VNLEPLKPDLPVVLKVEPNGLTRLTQEGNDHSMLVQAITVNCEEMFSTYTSVVPAPVTVDLSAVETYVKRALEIRQSDPLPPLQSVTVKVVTNGKQGAEARSCEVLLVNGVYVPLPGRPDRQPIPPTLGCMTGRLYALARDANVPIDKVEKFAEYLMMVNPHIRAGMDAAFHAIVDTARAFETPKEHRAQEEAESLKRMAGFTDNKE
jgi:hypothetical protein